MGTSVALELVRRGNSVSVFERFARGHARGSSHGPNRIFRVSYEDPVYVELALDSLEDWKRLERDSRLSEGLIRFIGGLDVGPGAHLCAEAMSAVQVDFEELAAAAVKSRWGLEIPEGPFIFQTGAGVIDAEQTIEAQARLASSVGAVFIENTQVQSLQRDESGVLLTTQHEEVRADAVVVCAGPWASSLLASTGIDLEVSVSVEQVSYLEDRPRADKNTPIVIDWSAPPRYLVPDGTGSIKVGSHVGSRGLSVAVDPDDGPFVPDEDRAQADLEWASRITGRELLQRELQTCLYTNAPNDDFIFQRHSQVVVISACSGHGFKFAPRIGRVAADLLDGKDPALPGRLGQWWRPPAESSGSPDL